MEQHEINRKLRAFRKRYGNNARPLLIDGLQCVDERYFALALATRKKKVILRVEKRHIKSKIGEHIREQNDFEKIKTVHYQFVKVIFREFFARCCPFIVVG